jgi:hypothetical protein
MLAAEPAASAPSGDGKINAPVASADVFRKSLLLFTIYQIC